MNKGSSICTSFIFRGGERQDDAGAFRRVLVHVDKLRDACSFRRWCENKLNDARVAAPDFPRITKERATRRNHLKIGSVWARERADDDRVIGQAE